MKLFAFKIVSKHRSFMFFAFIGNYINGRRPFLEFVHPVVDSREGYYYQKRSFVVFVFNQVSEKRDSLNSFAQSHLISQYSVEIIVVKTYHPVETKHLIALQLTTCEYGWLVFNILLHAVGDLIVDFTAVFHVVLN